MKQVLFIVSIIILIILGVYFFKPKSYEIQLGFIGSLTGSFAISGEESRNSILMATEEINNSGGILGKKINLYVEDGKCDSALSLNAWKKLVSVNNVKVIFGGHCSTETLAIDPLSKKDQVLALANFTSANKIVNEGEWVFRNLPPNNYYAMKSAGYVTESLKYKNIGYITEIKEFPKNFVDEFKRVANQNGAKEVFSEEFSPTNKDFRSILTKLKDKQVDIVVISTQGSDVEGLMAKQIKELGINWKQVYPQAFNLKAFVDGAGFVPKDAVVAVPMADPKIEKVGKYLEDYKKRFGSEITSNIYYVGATYDMVFRLKKYMEECNSTSDIECIRNKFKTATSYDSLFGELMLSDTYAPKTPIVPMGIMEFDEKGVVGMRGI